jgi:hypothetical protein
MNKYLIDWRIFIEQRLPYVLRKPLHFAWIQSLIAPFIALHDGFKTAAAMFRIKATITPQVRILRGALNDAFDAVERRIIIVDGVQEPFLFIYNGSENKPLFLKKYLTSSSVASFEVHIPAALLSQKDVINFFVKTHKLAGVKFKIVVV